MLHIYIRKATLSKTTSVCRVDKSTTSLHGGSVPDIVIQCQSRRGAFDGMEGMHMCACVFICVMFRHLSLDEPRRTC